jgi:glucose-1-phosphate adenylyltransferase
MELLHDDDSEFVFVLAGDHVYQMDYGDLLCQHVDTNADLTIATIEYSLDRASQFGVVEIDETLKVTGFEEKPSKPRSMPSDPSRALVSMGVYVFKKRILVESLRYFCENGIGYDFGHDIIPALIREGRTFAFDFRNKADGEPHYWRDIGTIDAYHQANMDLLQPGALFDPHLNRPMRYPLALTDWPEKRNFALIDRGVHLHRSVLSPGVELESGIVLEESVLMPGVRIGKGARLRRTIVEEGVAIPAGYHVGFDIESDRREHAVTENGIVVITHIPTSSKPKLLEFTTRRATARLSGTR